MPLSENHTIDVIEVAGEEERLRLLHLYAEQMSRDFIKVIDKYRENTDDPDYIQLWARSTPEPKDLIRLSGNRPVVYVGYRREWCVDVGERLAAAHPDLAFALEFGASDFGIAQRHWYAGGKHTHSQVQELRWGDKEPVSSSG